MRPGPSEGISLHSLRHRPRGRFDRASRPSRTTRGSGAGPCQDLRPRNLFLLLVPELRSKLAESLTRSMIEEFVDSRCPNPKEEIYDPPQEPEDWPRLFEQPSTPTISTRSWPSTSRRRASSPGPARRLSPRPIRKVLAGMIGVETSLVQSVRQGSHRRRRRSLVHRL